MAVGEVVWPELARLGLEWASAEAERAARGLLESLRGELGAAELMVGEVSFDRPFDELGTGFRTGPSAALPLPSLPSPSLWTGGTGRTGLGLVERAPEGRGGMPEGEATLQDQAAKELSIDLARGGMTAVLEDAEKQVRQAYGLETEPVEVPITLVSAVDEEAGWATAGGDMIAGLTAAMTDSSLVLEFVSCFKADITNNEASLKGAGEAVWDTVELGILARLDRADYATLFVTKLGPLVGTWLLENGRNTQGGTTP